MKNPELLSGNQVVLFYRFRCQMLIFLHDGRVPDDVGEHDSGQAALGHIFR
jgi:hypothetical protein